LTASAHGANGRPEDRYAEGVAVAARGEGAFRESPDAVTALVASAAYPGLGQLLNGTETKAAVIGAVEAFLIVGLVVEDRRTRNSLRRYTETGDSAYFDDYSDHFDQRQTLIWWVVGAALYGLADAYVDAHLSGFDGPSPRLEGGFGGLEGGKPGVRIGLAFSF
jgi:hypothetical protein